MAVVLGCLAGSQFFLNDRTHLLALFQPRDDLCRNRSLAVVAEEILRQQFRQLQRFLVFLPAAKLFHKLRMEFLEGLRFLEELLFEPLNGRGFIRDEKLELQNLSNGHALSVVFGHLFRQKVHAVTLGKALDQPSVEFASGQRNGYATLNMKGNHPVEEQVVLTLGDNLGLAVFGNKYRKLLQVSANEVPDAGFGTRFKLKAFLEAAVGFVGRNDQVLLDGGRRGLRIKSPLSFVQSSHTADNKPSIR